MSEWISVDKQLPAEQQEILWVSNGRVSVGHYAPHLQFPFRDKFGSGDGPSSTHWMPLPDLPK